MQSISTDLDTLYAYLFSLVHISQTVWIQATWNQMIRCKARWYLSSHSNSSDSILLFDGYVMKNVQGNGNTKSIWTSLNLLRHSRSN